MNTIGIILIIFHIRFQVDHKMAHIKWTEVQPAGDTNQRWYVSALSDDGSYILAGAGYDGSGKLYYSSNRGLSWTTLDPYGDSTDRQWWWGSISSDGTKMFVGVHSGKLWYSSNSGSSWSEIRTTGGYNGLAISSDGTKLFTCLYPNRCYYSTNSGGSWSEVQPKGDNNGNWNTCAMSDDGTKILVAENSGRSYYSTNSGSSWSEVQPNGNSNRAWWGSAISGSGETLLIGETSFLGKSTDSGSSWYQQGPGGSTAGNYWYCCAISSDNSTVLVGKDNGRLYIGTRQTTSTFYVNTGSTAGGTGTTNDTVGTNRAFASLGEAAAQLAWAASDSDLEIQCCGSATDNSLVDLATVYVQAAYTLYIKGNPTHANGQNTGVYDSSKYTKVKDATNNEGIRVSTTQSGQKINISKIQIRDTSQYLAVYIPVNGACDVTLDKCIISVGPGGSIYNFLIWQRNDGANISKLTIQNCVINNENVSETVGDAVRFSSNLTTSSIYNSVVRGFQYGVSKNGEAVTAKNCIVFDCSDDFSGITTIDHCASDDGDGTNPVSVSSWTDQFYSATYRADNNFTLKNTSVLLNAGIGPSIDALVPTTDIINLLRSGNTSTVGPFERYFGWKRSRPIPGRAT